MPQKTHPILWEKTPEIAVGLFPKLHPRFGDKLQYLPALLAASALLADLEHEVGIDSVPCLNYLELELGPFQHYKATLSQNIKSVWSKH